MMTNRPRDPGISLLSDRYRYRVNNRRPGCSERCPARCCPVQPSTPSAMCAPSVTCVAGFDSLFDISKRYAAQSVSIENAINPTMGEAPYTLTSADLVPGEAPILDLTITPAPHTAMVLITGTLLPNIQISYRDAQNVAFSKTLNFPVAIQLSFETREAVDGADVYGLIAGGNLLNASIQGTTFVFDYALDARVIGISMSAQRFPVLMSAQFPGCMAVQVEFFEAFSVCDSMNDALTLPGEIPFSDFGTPPYTLLSVEPLDTKPGVISATQLTASQVSYRVGMPVTLELSDSLGTLSTQRTQLFFSYKLSGAMLDSNALLLVDLDARVADWTVGMGSIEVALGNLRAYTVVLADKPCEACILPSVECGAFLPMYCPIS